MNNQEIKSNKSGCGGWGKPREKIEEVSQFLEKDIMEKIRDSF